MRKFAAYLILALSLLTIYGSAALTLVVKQEYEINAQIIVYSMIVNFMVMFVPAVLFVLLMYGEVWKKLYYRKEKALKSMIYGVLAAIAFMLITAVILYGIGYKEENPLAEEIGKSINIPLAFAISIMAAINEETFFRSLIHMRLENKIGFIPASLISSFLFAMAHLEYQTFLQIIMPFIFGMILAFLIHKFHNVIAPMAAHFIYNFIALSML